jgi:hypothetical protein
MEEFCMERKEESRREKTRRKGKGKAEKYNCEMKT